MLFLDAVKTCVHSITLIWSGLITYLVTVPVLGTSTLRKNPRFLLLSQQCCCLSAFSFLGLVLLILRNSSQVTTRLTYWILHDLQAVMDHGMTVTLAASSLCACVSILRPLHYPMLFKLLLPWMMLLIWLLASIIPVVFTVLTCIQEPWGLVIGPNAEGSTALESDACITSTLVLLGASVLLISSSYFLIYLEGCSAGHFTWSNKKGHCTILLHALQISLYFVPKVIIVSRLHQTQNEAVVTFLVFTSGQLLCPMLYGLRSKELQAELPIFLPQCLSTYPGVDMIANVDSANSESFTSSRRTASTDLSLRVVTSNPIWYLDVVPKHEVMMQPGTQRGSQEDVAPDPNLEN
ncbi:olfactory receptor 4C11-like [Astyanax mexicanus]|uniref:Olfactory receptor 4C11-like n=1 Tax=Astyanax mexicanus TaxID=7994 RepID=A0A8T2M488_ASTMX|nr:olfactory receptor 4C11-like [Astyanax mexicanus]